MPKQLLDAVNDVLIRTKNLDGDTRLTTVASGTDSARQNAIDTVIQVVNEEIAKLYNLIEPAFPTEVTETTITLVSGVRSYALPDNLVAIRWPLRDQVNGASIYEYPGGWEQIWEDQIQPDNFTGLPTLAVIDPANGELYVNQVPQDEEAGREFICKYDKELVLESDTDTFPFNDTVYRAMVPVWAEMWKVSRQANMDSPGAAGNLALARRQLGMAASILSRKQRHRHWTPRRWSYNVTDPFTQNNADPFCRSG